MKKDKDFIFKLVVFIILLCIIFVIKVIFSNNKTTKTSTNNLEVNTIINNIKTEKKEEKKGLYIKEHYIKNDFMKTIEGIVVNNTDNNYKYVTVEVQCYDINNNKIETSSDIILNLNANETWKFKIYVKSETYKYNISVKEN